MTTRTPVVVLDPGHGGNSAAGASSPNNTSGGGLLEKDLNLDIARRVRELLTRRATVFLTRDSDTNLSLAARAGFAKAMNADVFVSLHCNGHADTTQDTTEVYVRRSGGTRHQAFARDLHPAVAQATGAPGGGVTEADLGVLLADRHAPGTLAALVELFDLTNPTRAGLAATVPFLDRVAAAVAGTVEAHLPAMPASLSREATARTRGLSGSARATLNGARVLSSGVIVRSPEVQRAGESLRNRGVAEHDIQSFLDSLQGTGTPAALGMPRSLVLDTGETAVELPSAHLFEWWQEELIVVAMAGTPIGPILPALRVIANTYNVTIGIGPSLGGAVGGGFAGEVGLVIAPGNRVGFYGTLSALVGAIVSIDLTIAVTVVFGGPEIFSGPMITVGVSVSTGAGMVVAAHALISPSTRRMVGVAGEVGAAWGPSPFEAFARFQHTVTTLGVPAARVQSTDSDCMARLPASVHRTS